MPAPFPILAREGLMRAAKAVEAGFPDDKRPKIQWQAHEFLAEPLANAATAKATPKLVAEYDTFHHNGWRDGHMTVVESKGMVFTFHEKMQGQTLELRCYQPLPVREFDLRKLMEGGVAKLYGKRDGGNVPRVTFDVSPSGVATYIMGERQGNIPFDWAKGASEMALALMARARDAHARARDNVVEIEPGVVQERPYQKPLHQKLAEAQGKASVGPYLGHDLENAFSWRGQVIAVTSNRTNAEPLHIMIERRGNDGSGVWDRVPVPDDPAFPRKGAGVVLDGDKLRVFGGVDAEGKVVKSHWVLDLANESKSGWGGASWKPGAALKEGTAYPAVAANDRDAMVIGGVAGYFLKRNAEGADDKVQQRRRTTQVGGYSNWRDRAAAPTDTAGSATLMVSDPRRESSALFVGPPKIDKSSTEKVDSRVVVWDVNEAAWFALPPLPFQTGEGQLQLSSANGKRELVYSGGFDRDGKAQKEIWSIDLDDLFGGWQKRGENDALAGKARTVARDGKLVSLMVSPKGSLMVHLE